jgi:CRISPR associated protein
LGHAQSLRQRASWKLAVTGPVLFGAALAGGVGHASAFGRGLLSIRHLA